MDTATRNRQIKKILTERFGQGNVKVRGSRGTGYGWVSVTITTPEDGRRYSEQYAEIMQLLKGVEIGTYGYDDPGSDYGYGSKIDVSFDTPEIPA